MSEPERQQVHEFLTIQPSDVNDWHRALAASAELIPGGTLWPQGFDEYQKATEWRRSDEGGHTYVSIWDNPQHVRLVPTHLDDVLVGDLVTDEVQQLEAARVGSKLAQPDGTVLMHMPERGYVFEADHVVDVTRTAPKEK